jgi:hypothetical protein
MRKIVPFKLRKLIKKWMDKLGSSYFNLSAIDDTLPEDLFIAGYPKSGNTWLQNIVVELLYDVDSSKISDPLLQELVPDVHFKRYYKRFIGSMPFKTHFLPHPKYRRVLYIVRDGRDVMTSYYHYLTALGHGYNSIGDLIKKGDNLFPSSWDKHVRDWVDNPYKADMLIVRYEDLLNSPKETIVQVAEFLDLNVTMSKIEKTINRTSFLTMQKKEKKLGWEDERQWPKGKLFVRRGISGGFKDEMTLEEVQLFNDKSRGMLDHFGYKT